MLFNLFRMNPRWLSSISNLTSYSFSRHTTPFQFLNQLHSPSIPCFPSFVSSSFPRNLNKPFSTACSTKFNVTNKASLTNNTNHQSESLNSPKPKSLWYSYLHKVKKQPASHLTARFTNLGKEQENKTFLILHEITAIVPFVLVFSGLYFTGIQVPLPEFIVESCDEKIKKIVGHYDWHLNTSTLFHMISSYAIVKMMLPFRLGLCFWLTPACANYIHRLLLLLDKNVKRFLKTQKND